MSNKNEIHPPSSFWICQNVYVRINDLHKRLATHSSLYMSYVYTPWWETQKRHLKLVAGGTVAMLIEDKDGKRAKLTFYKALTKVMPTNTNYQRHTKTFVILSIFISKKKIDEETIIPLNVTMEIVKNVWNLLFYHF